MNDTPAHHEPERAPDEVADSLGLTGQTDIAFSNVVPEGLEVDADPDQLFRILNNLGRNAVQALEPDDNPARRIVVSAARRAGGTEVTVDDNGPGMPPKARDNLFSAFRGSVRAGGTGLGLAIARELIEAHGGRITLADKKERGTRFVFEIPDRPPA